MAISRSVLKEVMLDNQKDVERYAVSLRDYPLDSFPLQVLVGVRRCGKSFILFQMIKKMLNEGHHWDEMAYLDFEDLRLAGFTAEDFNLILECHAELYGKRPILFLDEIQNIDGWEAFARNLADKKYSVYITGSNAKMLSREIMGKLGGRYIATEVYPLSFREYLSFKGIAFDEKALLATESRAQVLKAYEEYLQWGGMPETVDMNVKRNYLASVYQKIYIGDIVMRNGIANPKMLQLMLKKMSESVIQPISYNRISRILSSMGGKISVPTVSSYIECAEEAWLILRLRNAANTFIEKESICKYYFIDNGILSLLLMKQDALLLENMVALELFRRYGHDQDNERVFFYNDKVEVDFVVPEEELAIQVSTSIKDDVTRQREVDALTKLANVMPCKRRVILTQEEEETIEDVHGTIEVTPCWKWLLRGK